MDVSSPDGHLLIESLFARGGSWAFDYGDDDDASACSVLTVLLDKRRAR